MSKNPIKLIGTETEFLLLNNEGFLADTADTIIKNSKNDGTIVEESTHNVVEINSIPAISITELKKNLRNQFIKLDTISTSIGIRAIPISQLDPSILRLRKNSLRYRTNALVFGEKKINLYNAMCGTHVHIDKAKTEKRVIDQFNLLQSLYPSFAFNATSPYLKGNNSYNSCRVQHWQKTVFSSTPLHGRLSPYANSIKNIKSQKEKCLASWLSKAGKNPELKKVFDGTNTYWGPTRIQKKTIETRASDSNILSCTVAEAALKKGINELILTQDLDVVISKKHGYFCTNNSSITLPSYETLLFLEEQAVRFGLKSKMVYAYLHYLIDLAEKGLSDEDSKALNIYKAMLKYKKNLSDTLQSFAKRKKLPKNGKIDAHGASNIYLYMYDIHKRDIQGEDISAVLTE